MASILKNKGYSGTDAQMFTGRALSFDSASSQSIDYASGNYHTQFTSTDTTILWNGNTTVGHPYLSLWNGNSAIAYYDSTSTYNAVAFVFSTVKSYAIKTYSTYFELYENGVLVLTENTNGYVTGGDRSFGKRYTSFSSGGLGNVVFYNGHLTQQQISDYHATPHTFLYKTESGLASDSGLDTSKVVAWFPLTEDDGYVRDMVGYSEVYVNGSFDNNGLGWVGDYTDFSNNSFQPTVASSTVYADYIDCFEVGKTYVLSFDIVQYQSGLVGMSSYVTGTGYYPNAIGRYIIPIVPQTTTLRMVGTEGNFEIDNIKVIESGIYPITNYTTDMPLKGLNYGLQTAKLLLDDNGVVIGKSDFAEFYGDGYVDTGWIPYTEENFTVELSCNVDEKKLNQIGALDGVTSKRLAIDFNANGYIYITCNTSIQYNLIYAYSVNTVYDIVIIVDGLTIKVYIDKSLKKTLELTSKQAGSKSFYIGAINKYNGTIYNDGVTFSKFKVHNKILTDEEIQAL